VGLCSGEKTARLINKPPCRISSGPKPQQKQTEALWVKYPVLNELGHYWIFIAV